MTKRGFRGDKGDKRGTNHKQTLLELFLPYGTANAIGKGQAVKEARRNFCVKRKGTCCFQRKFLRLDSAGSFLIQNLFLNRGFILFFHIEIISFDKKADYK